MLVGHDKNKIFILIIIFYLKLLINLLQLWKILQQLTKHFEFTIYTYK